MSSNRWLPGDLVVVLPSTLVARLNSNAEQYTAGMKIGLMICASHRWEEPGADGEADSYYVVFFGESNGQMRFGDPNDNASQGFYTVPGSRIIHPDKVNDPGRLFGAYRLQD